MIAKAQLLQNWTDRAISAPFAWGEHDCVLAACEWIHQRTGKHPLPNIAGTYHGPLCAARVIKRYGSCLRMACIRVMAENGYRHIRPAEALPGDVVGGVFKNGYTLGVCIGAKTIFPGEHGGVAHRTLDTIDAWRID